MMKFQISHKHGDRGRRLETEKSTLNKVFTSCSGIGMLKPLMGSNSPISIILRSIVSGILRNP